MQRASINETDEK